MEKHTNSIFAKLGLSEERDLNRRVKAVLLYLFGRHPQGEADLTNRRGMAAPSAEPGAP